MIKLLVIADDFTGALDTGVQFARKGASTLVSCDLRIDISQLDVEVLVVNADTRHLEPIDAGALIFTFSRKAIINGVSLIYKKTDSGLRGNIGQELEALLLGTASNAVFFAPAYPRMNRVTRDGIHYIDGIPLAESVFCKDPYEPALYSYVPDIIASQSDVPVIRIEEGHLATPSGPSAIYLYDAWEQAHLDVAVPPLSDRTLLAGCAGFAESLAEQMSFTGVSNEKPPTARGLIVICGSINPISLEQIQYTTSAGFAGLTISPIQSLVADALPGVPDRWLFAMLDELDQLCTQSSMVIVSAALTEDDVAETSTFAASHGIPPDGIRKMISGSLGVLAHALTKRHPEHALVIIGGDTLMSTMEHLNINSLTPLEEPIPGVVLSQIMVEKSPMWLASKSGGFGNADTLIDLYNYMCDRDYINTD